jgi:hypothetical protein
METILPKYVRIQLMFIKNKYNSSSVYTLTPDVVCFSWPRLVGKYIVTDICIQTQKLSTAVNI